MFKYIVDLLVIIHNVHYIEFLNKLNFIERKLKFTVEIEKNRKPNFISSSITEKGLLTHWIFKLFSNSEIFFPHPPNYMISNIENERKGNKTYRQLIYLNK